MLLAIDTSTDWIGMALFDGEQIISEQIWQTHNRHTVELVPAIRHLLERSNVKKTELTGLGVALGPGSFTSLRIGITVMKGFSLALKIPVVGLPSLDILAAGQPPLEIPLWAVLHAGRKLLAFSPYKFEGSTWVRQEDAVVIKAKELEDRIKEPVYICGELSEQDRKILGRKWKTVQLASPANCLRRPAILAELAWQKLQSNDGDDSTSLSPIYLHTSTPIPE
ncbi:MAG: tRNA (adenosine(37)-N6)-threonylcarbamoyltransferase complex dimerization subunit type 1 TsaB [Anaerolineaceae bacterium]|nr:tRNA (adenosine(37)-N6)-threonylcarbamoyltransferase complex dimerization subunit type 1 TsaB [Anaerolineaceae bacterium]